MTFPYTLSFIFLGSGTATLTGEGTLTAFGRYRAAPLSGRGALSVVVDRTSSGLPWELPFILGFGPVNILPGHGALTVTANPILKAPLTGHGALTVHVGGIWTLWYTLPFVLGNVRPAPLASAGVLSAAIKAKVTGALTGHGTLSRLATSFGVGHGRLSTTVVPKLTPTALTGAGHITGIGYGQYLRNTPLLGVGALICAAFSPVKYDATGPGFTSSGTSQATWLHPAVTDAYVLVQILSTPAPATVFYGGTPMSLLGEASVSSGFGALTFYGLGNVAGAGNITVTWPWAAQDVVANSTSYTSVGSAGALQAVSNQYSYKSKQGRISCPAQGVIVQAFAGVLTANSSVYLTDYTGGTMRWTSQINQFTSGPTSAMCIVGDSAKRSAFAADLFGIGRIGYTWAAAAVALAPA